MPTCSICHDIEAGGYRHSPLQCAYNLRRANDALRRERDAALVQTEQAARDVAFWQGCAWAGAGWLSGWRGACCGFLTTLRRIRGRARR